MVPRTALLSLSLVSLRSGANGKPGTRIRPLSNAHLRGREMTRAGTNRSRLEAQQGVVDCHDPIRPASAMTISPRCFVCSIGCPRGYRNRAAPARVSSALGPDRIASIATKNANGLVLRRPRQSGQQGHVISAGLARIRRGLRRWFGIHRHNALQPLLSRSGVCAAQWGVSMIVVPVRVRRRAELVTPVAFASSSLRCGTQSADSQPNETASVQTTALEVPVVPAFTRSEDTLGANP